jgi:GTP-binding protein Era
VSYRAGYVGLIGQPNAGKSTLLNALVEEKISIVTEKPQTTRRRVLGVVNQEQGQIVYVDAPGWIRAEEGLNHFLQKEAEDVAGSSDALVLVISLDQKDADSVTQIFAVAEKSKKPFFIVVTKADLVDKKHRLEKIKEMATDKFKNSFRGRDIPIIEFSSKWGKDAESVLTQIKEISLSLLPETPAPLYDTEIFTPHTVRELCEEIIREQCFELLDKEIPYGIAVRVATFDESNPDMPRIHADILVPRETHRPIVVGKKAAVVKEIGIRARKEIERMVGTQVFLKLEVLVRKDWTENTRLMKDLGYVIKK